MKGSILHIHTHTIRVKTHSDIHSWLPMALTQAHTRSRFVDHLSLRKHSASVNLPPSRSLSPHECVSLWAEGRKKRLLCSLWGEAEFFATVWRGTVTVSGCEVRNCFDSTGRKVLGKQLNEAIYTMRLVMTLWKIGPRCRRWEIKCKCLVTSESTNPFRQLVQFRGERLTELSQVRGRANPGLFACLSQNKHTGLHTLGQVRITHQLTQHGCIWTVRGSQSAWREPTQKDWPVDSHPWCSCCEAAMLTTALPVYMQKAVQLCTTTSKRVQVLQLPAVQTDHIPIIWGIMKWRIIRKRHRAVEQVKSKRDKHLRFKTTAAGSRRSGDATQP